MSMNLLQLLEKARQTGKPRDCTMITNFAIVVAPIVTFFSWIHREEIGNDDMDIRVKYAGMFHRKKATPGRFMMRLRLPNGIINSGDMR